MTRSCCSILALILLAAAPPAVAADNAPRCVTILSTTDLHGAIEPHVDEDAGRRIRVGGMLVLATYVERLRSQAPGHVLLVDSGDIFQGTIVSNLSQGRAMLAAMNALAYDGAAIGNHEFDFGDGKPAIGSLAGRDLTSVLRARIAAASFPFLAVNVVDRKTGRLVDWPNVRPTVLLERGGIRIGLVGASTPETPRVTRPQFVAGLSFPDGAEPVARAARELRAAGAELVVLTAHSGLDGELTELLARLPAGTVDVVLGGHTHQASSSWLGNIAVSQAGSRARWLGWVDACVRPGGGLDHETSHIHAPIPLCLDAWSDGSCGPRGPAGDVRPATFLGREVTPSAELEAVLAPYRDEVKTQATRPIGAHLDEPLPVHVGSTSPLGDVVMEAMRRASGVSIALQNRGGLRAGLPAGELTYADAFEAMPFDNHLAVLRLTGIELEAVLGHLVARGREGPLVSGLRVEQRDGRLLLSLPDGSPVEASHTYPVVTNDYLAMGGEGLAKVLDKVPAERVVYADLDVRTALVDYLRWRYPSRP
jgi:5'-nucleotidase